MPMMRSSRGRPYRIRNSCTSWGVPRKKDTNSDTSQYTTPVPRSRAWQMNTAKIAAMMLGASVYINVIGTY